MKKVLSLLISAVLFSTALFAGIPVSANAVSETLPATPITDYAISAPFWEVVATQSVIPETTKKFVTANGIKISSADGKAKEFTTAANSQILASALYEESSPYEMPADFADNGSFIIYVKTATANELYLLIRTESPAMWFTYGALAENSSYQYLSVGGNEWVDSTVNGNVISFDGAFEGYLKIPVSSLVSLDGVSMIYAHIIQISTYFKNIGGEYGDIITGPFFVTTSNSESAKIEVPEQYQPAPIPVTPITGYTMVDYWYEKVSHKAVMPNAIGKFVTADGIEMKSVSGNALTYDSATNSEILAGANYTETMTDAYQMPTDFDTKGSFIFYVKIGGANDIYFSVRTECPGQWFTTGELAQNASYEYLPIGGDEWISATANGNLISFDDAFSGYIKVSVTSLKSVDGVYMSFTRLSQIAARFKNIGGAYGDIIAGPFFTTIADSASTKFIIPEEYQPAPLDIKSFDLGEVRASAYNFTAGKIQNTKNYDLYIDELIIPEEGSVKHEDGVTEWSYVENEDGQEALGGAACLIMNPAIKTYMKDAQGIVFYVELPKANMFSPSLIFGDQAIMLKPGATVQLLQNGSDEWTDATVNQGLTGNTAIYGTVKFDSAFSGYIKVPFTSLNSDWGWKPTLTGDNLTALTSVAVRFKGVGDDAKYGSHITVGLTGYYTADTARPEIGTIAIPNYPTGDANYDWKVNSDDLISIKKTLLGIEDSTGYKVDVIDFIRVKKILANATV